MVNFGMTSPGQLAATRRAAAVVRTLADEVRQLREDCGVSQRALARATGISQSVISRVEAGVEVPSIETYARIANGLGADLSVRIYPNTGPSIRDRHQARIVEALLRAIDSHWTPFPEVAVRNPSRGWIDLVLVRRSQRVVVAAEIESMPRRLEQVLRWSAAKADSLPSASTFPFGIDADPVVHRLLVLRDTRANRDLAAAFTGVLKAAYSADPWQARAALAGDSSWPGNALLWASERRDRTFEIEASALGRGRSADR